MATILSSASAAKKWLPWVLSGMIIIALPLSVAYSGAGLFGYIVALIITALVVVFFIWYLIVNKTQVTATVKTSARSVAESILRKTADEA